jgi:hypothetical protein
MNTTKLRYLVAENPNELEGLVQALGFKVEVKSVNWVGGKWFCWFTVMQTDELQRKLLPESEQAEQKTKAKKQKTKN